MRSQVHLLVGLHLGQFARGLRDNKDGISETEAIRVQLSLLGRLQHKGTHGIMGQQQCIDLLHHSLGRTRAQDGLLQALRRFDLIQLDFHLPALMIRIDEFEGGGRARVEPGSS